MEIAEDFLYSARAGDLEELKSQIKAQPSLLTATDDHLNTGLHLAAANGHIDIVVFLINSPGIHLNAVNEAGSTSLHWSSLNNHLTVVKALVVAGADAWIKNGAGNTAAVVAEQAQRWDVVAYLLEHMQLPDEEEGEELEEQGGENQREINEHN